MTCACGREVAQLDWSLEFGAFLCDPCYGRMLSRARLTAESDAARAVAVLHREAADRRAGRGVP